jgi:hypothetical protein
MITTIKMLFDGSTLKSRFKTICENLRNLRLNFSSYSSTTGPKAGMAASSASVRLQ